MSTGTKFVPVEVSVGRKFRPTDLVYGQTEFYFCKKSAKSYLNARQTANFVISCCHIKRCKIVTTVGNLAVKFLLG